MFIKSLAVKLLLMGKSQYLEKEQDFRLRIPLVPSDELTDSVSPSKLPNVPRDLIDAFRRDGFIVLPNVASTDAIEALNDHLEDVLRGTYDRGNKPDKVPWLVKRTKPITSSCNASPYQSNPATQKRPSVGALGFSGNLQNVKVLQIINIHKADSLFRKLETNKQLGSVVSQLAGWRAGARLAQDQVWAKPPGAPPLVFHRDSPYFMFQPDDVVTVWFALDDMDEELGPLEYVRGSHLWGDGRVGSAGQFFHHDVRSLLRSAAEQEGIDPATLDIVSMSGLSKGSISIHHGKTWHGSGENTSKSKPRRGLGIHYVPANVRFTAKASQSSLWKSYVANSEDPSTIELSNEDFPIT